MIGNTFLVRSVDRTLMVVAAAESSLVLILILIHRKCMCHTPSFYKMRQRCELVVLVWYHSRLVGRKKYYRPNPMVIPKRCKLSQVDVNF
eukprot:scaffold1933_cov165-Amphora_coffeaeformis.AAC.8